MTTTSENITNWRSLSDIDYFTQYIKSYLAFNAWMRARYPSGNRDRVVIDKIKVESNEFKRQIIVLLQDSGVEGEKFRSHVSSLHDNLSRYEIKNNAEKISFYNVFIEPNSNNALSSMRNRINYSVEIFADGKVAAKIIDSSGSEKFKFEHRKYDISLLTECEDFNKLTRFQKMELANLFKECNPRKTDSIISDKATGIKIGQFYFIEDYEKVSKGIIEVLYSLRNSLFHGEVLPDKDSGKVYESSYHILKKLIQIL